MPRARTNDAEDDIVISKPRARKPRVISADVENKPPVRKRAPARSKVAPVLAEPVTRKAPTPIQTKRRQSSRNAKVFFTVLGACVLLSGIGLTIGVLDKGTIDVVAVVNDRNEKISKGEVRDESGKTITQTLQVQSDTRPNGGLPMGDPVVVPPVPVTETSTSTEVSSSTPSVASSTEDSLATTTPTV
jgi:hypothetical protein